MNTFTAVVLIATVLLIYSTSIPVSAQMEHNFFFKDLEGVTEWGKYTHMSETPDGSYVLPFNDSVVSHHLRLYGSYERPYLDMILAFMDEMQLNNHPNTVMFDIGANVGAWTLGMSTHVGPLGKVYAFEVQRNIIMHLSATLVYNGISNVYPVHGAVTNMSGFTDMFHLTEEKVVNFGAFSIQGHRRESEGAQVRYRIPNIVLDDYFYDDKNSAFECPSFIKMDVELHEIYTLLGAEKLLLQCQPVLFMEANCGRLVKSMVLLVDSFGYDLAWVVAPLVYPHLEHYGRRMHTPKFEHTSDFYRDQMFGGPNLIALPRDSAGDVHVSLMEQLAEMYPGSIRHIDVASGVYDLETYALSYCVGSAEEPQCANAKMPADSCIQTSIDPFIEHYWERLRANKPKKSSNKNSKKNKKVKKAKTKKTKKSRMPKKNI